MCTPKSGVRRAVPLRSGLEKSLMEHLSWLLWGSRVDRGHGGEGQSLGLGVRLSDPSVITSDEVH